MASSDSNNSMFQQQQPSENTNNHSPNNNRHHHHHYQDEKADDDPGSAKFGDYELSSGNPFNIPQTKNASLETLKQWRPATSLTVINSESLKETAGQPTPSRTIIDPNSLRETSVQINSNSLGETSLHIGSDSLGETSVQPPRSQTVVNPDTLGEASVEIAPDSLGGTSIQPPPSQPIVDPKSPPIKSDTDKKKIKWQNIVLTFCFTTAIGIAIQSTDTKSKYPPSFQWLSLANVLTFSALFVAKFVGKVSPTAVKVLEQGAILLAATIFFLATTISMTQHFKYVTWAIYVVTMIVVLICCHNDRCSRMHKIM